MLNSSWMKRQMKINKIYIRNSKELYKDKKFLLENKDVVY